jgi:hypothetical protein
MCSVDEPRLRGCGDEVRVPATPVPQQNQHIARRAGLSARWLVLMSRPHPRRFGLRGRRLAKAALGRDGSVIGWCRVLRAKNSVEEFSVSTHDHPELLGVVRVLGRPPGIEIALLRVHGRG